MNRQILSILITILFVNVSFAQTETEVEPVESLSLTEQFRAFRAEADNYGEYKVIKASKLNTFWSIVQDSLKLKNAAIANATATVETLNGTIVGLEENLSTTQVALEESKAESASLSVLGIQVDKHNFAIAFWVITLLLAAGLAVAIFLYRQSNVVTRRTLKDNQEQSNEITQLRQKYMDREIKLKRELQTERNKVEELRNKIMA